MANDRFSIPAPASLARIANPYLTSQPAYLDRLQTLYGSAPIQVAQKVTATEALLCLLGAGGTGAILGVLQSELKNGLDYGGKVPIDGLFALIATVGGVAYNSPGSLRAGQNAAAIYSFRKTAGLLTMLRGMVTSTPRPVATPDMSKDTLGEAAADL